MKVAPIPPVSMLDLFAHEPYHLCLLVECLRSEQYRDFYARQAAQGHHVILDNSAHELGHSRDISSLLEMAKIIRPTEIVLPDRLFFGDDTARMSAEAAGIVQDELPGMGMMVVPQGRTFEEWRDCLYSLLHIEGLTVVGISKDYEVWHGGLRYLVSLVPSLMPIHLLGLGRQPRGLIGIGRDFPNVRGIDTAKPFVYADAGLELDGTLDTPRYPGRENTYFEASAGQYDLHLKNWEAFRSMIANFVSFDSPLSSTEVGTKTPITI